MKKPIVFCLVVLLSITSCTSKEEAVNQPTEDQQTTEKLDTEQETKKEQNKEQHTANQETSELPVEEKAYGIKKYPPVFKAYRDKLRELPEHKEGEGNWQVDLRSYDLSELNIEDRYDDLKYADFDTDTKWPNYLPSNYDPDHVMSLGKDPGLNVKELHAQGITGKGISVAIIDQTLLVEHEEYGDRIKMYEEIHCLESNAQMHGSAVTSILAGNTIGVAPEANVFYIAETHGEVKGDVFEYDYTYLAQSIHRIIEVNSTLPDEEKIRVLSIQLWWLPSRKGYNDVVEAVEEAKENGIFVVSSCIENIYEGFHFHGLGREIDKDPNSIDSYQPGTWWEIDFYENNEDYKQNTYEVLMVPMDSRATASPTGKKDYVFYRAGGWSWSIPYIAGLYALACQVEPSITPEQFWKIALATGDTIEFEHEGKTYSLGKIANPVKLLKEIEDIR